MLARLSASLLAAAMLAASSGTSRADPLSHKLLTSPQSRTIAEIPRGVTGKLASRI